MLTEIEIALVGRDAREFLPRGPESFRRSFFDEDENSRSWSERRRVTLTVDDAESLTSIFDRAVEAFNVFDADWSKWDGTADYGTYRYIALRDDSSPIPLIDRLSQILTLVDETGRASWGVWLQGVSYGELRAAAKAGAMPGDAKRIYLNVRLSTPGNGVLIDWEFVLQIWDIAWKVVMGLAAVSGAHDLYGKVRARLRGRKVVERKTTEWLRRNGHADYLNYMLRGEPWASRDLAGLLGCTIDEAEQVLALYGYERTGIPGKWTYVGGDLTLGLSPEDLSARVVASYMKEARFRYGHAVPAPEEALSALFAQMLRQAVEHGEITGLRHEESDLRS